MPVSAPTAVAAPAIAKRVVLSQIEVQPNSIVQVRLEKQVVEGDQVLSREYHRTVVTPGIRVDDQIAAVNAHLFLMGWPPVDPDTVDRIKRIVRVEQTPAVVKAWLDRIAAEAKAEREEEARQASEKKPNK